MEETKTISLKNWQWFLIAAAGLIFVVVAIGGPWLAAAQSTKSAASAADVHQVVVELQAASKTNHRLEVENSQILTAQLPALQDQIKALKQTNSDQASEITQAVAAIQTLAAQVIKLGGNPGEITIKPPSHQAK